MLLFHRARKMATLMLTVCAFVATGLTFAVPAQAATDMSGPVLLSPSVTSTNLNHYVGPATINIKLRLTDATGVETPHMIASWVNPDPCWWCGGSGQSQGFGAMTLASGTRQDGIWKHTITIPQGAATGQWEITLYPLSDTWGNRSSFFQTLKTVNVINAIPVTPAPVTFIDQVDVANDTYTVPATKGAEYVLSGNVVAAGTYPGKDTVKITARARSGYVLAPNTASSWTATFKGLLVAAVPTITGSAKVGATLTANPGTWGPAPVTLQYQWYRSGIAITGATAATRTLTTTDAGKTLTVRVTGTKPDYTSVSETSAPTAAVAKGSLITAVPTITGTAKVGSTLTANPGTWGPAPVTLQYQWYRSGIAITGATAATRTLTTTDAGKTLTVRVTGTKFGYTTVRKTSSATAPVTQ